MTDSGNQTPTLPTDPPPTGTIDITNLVEAMKNTWVKWATTSITTAAAATPYTFWIKWPVIGTLFSLLVQLGVTFLANTAEMAAFFLNTAIRKEGQAQDYIDALNVKNSLPPTASDEEYENAEQAEMAAFRNFVMVTN